MRHYCVRLLNDFKNQMFIHTVNGIKKQIMLQCTCNDILRLRGKNCSLRIVLLCCVNTGSTASYVYSPT